MKMNTKTLWLVAIALFLISLAKTLIFIVLAGLCITVFLYYKSEIFSQLIKSFLYKKHVNAGLYMFDDGWMQIGERSSYPFHVDAGTRLPKIAVRGQMFFITKEYYE